MTTEPQVPERERRFAQLVAIHLAAEAKSRGFTQQQLAAGCGVGAVQMSYYVKGQRGLMTLGHLVGGCDLIGCAPELIVKRAHDALMNEAIAQSPELPD